ncbi:MAG: hypothetical protein ACFFG0_40270, partial [Candidatus Thorarchaeota archaeon]
YNKLWSRTSNLPKGYASFTGFLIPIITAVVSGISIMAKKIKDTVSNIRDTRGGSLRGTYKRNKYTQEDLDRFADAVLEYGKFLKSLFIKSGLILSTATNEDFEEFLSFKRKAKFFTTKANRIRKGTNFALDSLYLNLELNIRARLSSHDWTIAMREFRKVYDLSRPSKSFGDFVREVKEINSIRRLDLRVLVTNTLRQIICTEYNLKDMELATLNDLFYGGKQIRTYGSDRGEAKLNSILKILYYNDILTREIFEARLRQDALASKELLKISLDLNKFLRIKEYVRSELIKIVFNQGLYSGRPDLLESRDTDFYIPEFELFLELWIVFSQEKGAPLSRNEFFDEIGFCPSFAIPGVVGILQWKYFSLLNGFYDARQGIFRPGLIHTRLTLQNQIRASEALSRYGLTRDIWTRGAPQPHDLRPFIIIEKINKLINEGFKDFGEHIIKMFRLGGAYPIEMSGFGDYYRSSDLNAMLYEKVLGKDLKTELLGKINKYLASIEYIYGRSGIVNEILEYSQNSHYKKLQRTGAGGAPDHKFVGPKIVEKVKGAFASEILFWFDAGSDKVFGHPDVLAFDGKVLYVCDYKPNLDFKGRTYSSDFINAIPQIVSYALMIKKTFKIKDVKCLIFNQEGAKVFDPSIVFNEIRAILIRNKIQSQELFTWGLFL